MRHSSAETGRSLRGSAGLLPAAVPAQQASWNTQNASRQHILSDLSLQRALTNTQSIIPRIPFSTDSKYFHQSDWVLRWAWQKKFHKFMLLRIRFMHYSLMDFIYPNLVNSGWTDSQLSSPEGNCLETPSPDALSACWCRNAAHESISLKEGKCIYLLTFAHSFMGWFCCCGLCGACCEMKISSMPGEPRKEEDSH